MRGVIVGEVRDGRRRAPTAPRIELAHQPGLPRRRSRPTSRARLLPKTLFGERYVALSCPPSPGRRAAGRRRRDRPGPQRERHRAAEGPRRHCCRCCRRCSRRTSRTPSARSPTRCAAAATPRREPASHRRTTSGRSTRCCRSCRPTSPSWPTSPTPTTRPPTTCSPSSTTCRSPTDHGRPAGAAAPHLHRRATRRRTSTAGFLETNEQNLISLAADLAAGARRVRQVLARVPLPAQRADPVRPDDQRGLRRRRRPGAEPEHHRQPAAAQPLRARRPAGVRRHRAAPTAGG